jgi:hypothetical protein
VPLLQKCPSNGHVLLTGQFTWTVSPLDGCICGTAADTFAQTSLGGLIP